MSTTPDEALSVSVESGALTPADEDIPIEELLSPTPLNESISKSPPKSPYHNGLDLELTSDDITFNRYIRQKTKRTKHRTFAINARISCWREAPWIILAWLSFILMMVVHYFSVAGYLGKTNLYDFYDKYDLSVTPSSWIFGAWGLAYIWTAMYLTYLTILLAEYSTKVFIREFYISFCVYCFANIVWPFAICYEVYSADLLSLICAVIAMSTCAYIAHRHTFDHFYHKKSIFPPRNVVALIRESRTASVLSRDRRPTPIAEEKPLDLDLTNSIAMAASSAPDTLSTKLLSSPNIQNNPSSHIPNVRSKSALSKTRELSSLTTAREIVFEPETSLSTRNEQITEDKHNLLVGVVLNGLVFMVSVCYMALAFHIGLFFKYKVGWLSDTQCSFLSLSLVMVSYLTYVALELSVLSRYLIHIYTTHCVVAFDMTGIVARRSLSHISAAGRFSIICCVLVYLGLIVKLLQTVLYTRLKRIYKTKEKQSVDLFS